MSLEKIIGLHRASLCLAVGFIKTSDYAPDTFKKCRVVVANYLNENGLVFNFDVKSNKRLVRKIVNLAEEVVFDGVDLETALVQLENYLF